MKSWPAHVVLLLAAVAQAGAETATDKFQALVQEKRGLQRESRFLKQEADLAVTKSPYILLDVAQKKLEFRCRGTPFKTYTFTSVSLDPRGRTPAAPETVWRAVDGPLTVTEVEGAHPELIPPDPNSGEEGALLYSDPNQLAAQTGAAPVRTDAGVLGVDAPTEYYIKLKEDVVLHVRMQTEMTFSEKARERFGEMLSGLREAFSGLWGGRQTDAEPKPRLSLYLVTDPDTAKFLHFSLLPGEKIIVTPPPPPPIVLVASK